MKRGDLAKADLRLPEWTDGMPGHTVICREDLLKSFGMHDRSLGKAIDRGDFPRCDTSPSEIMASSAKKTRCPALRKAGTRAHKQYWHLSTVRAWLESRKGSKL